MQINVTEDTFRLKQAFVISRGSRTEARVLTVCVERDGVLGYGECVPYARYDETMESVADQIRGLKLPLKRQELQDMLPGGAARNAVDCALWDLEAKQAGKRVWDLAGLPEPGPEITAFTLSLGTPESMRTEAAKNAHRPLLKVKLGGEGDLERLRAVRSGAPDAAMIVDANEGWTPESYAALALELLALGVKMVEQPLPAGADDALRDMDRPLPVCADESCHDRASLPALTGKYDMVNIKLDKTGGLTEALLLKQEAIAQGYDIMIGCMVGSSLAMAPAVLLAQGAAFTDLDGPLLLSEDRANALKFDDLGVHPPDAKLWG
jgi:L-alanine-DL-glutamate epimerase-like enolase superfamily enzyme